MFNWLPGTLAVISFVLQFSLVSVVLLTKRRQETATVAWIITIITLPYIGAILYLIFGINRVESTVKHRLRAWRRLSHRLPELSERHLLESDRLTPLQSNMAKVATRLAESRPTMHNRVDLLHDAGIAFDEIEIAIRNARATIHLEYYIWQPDKIGTRLRDLLIEKARTGVKVRFLYDSIGSLRLSRRFIAPMREAGIEISAFVPGRGWLESWSLNLRNHRKIIIVDGEIGFTGGMNVGDEYLSRVPHFGHWSDTHLRLVGPSVLQLQMIFAEDWHCATGREISWQDDFPRPETHGHVEAQVVSGGPHMEDSVFQALFFAAINEARHHITITTGYFVPTNALVVALECAAVRGVKVRLLLSGAKGYWYTRMAGRSSYSPLLRAGAEIWEYNRGYLHSKTLTLDGEYSLVGSPNFDSRSVFLNFEVAVAMYDKGIAEQLNSQFEIDVRQAEPIEKSLWFKRSRWQKLQENWARMFAPIL